MSWFVCSKCSKPCKVEMHYADTYKLEKIPCFADCKEQSWYLCDPPENDPLRKADVELDSYIKGLEAENDRLKAEIERLKAEISSRKHVDEQRSAIERHVNEEFHKVLTEKNTLEALLIKALREGGNV